MQTCILILVSEVKVLLLLYLIQRWGLRPKAGMVKGIPQEMGEMEKKLQEPFQSWESKRKDEVAFHANKNSLLTNTSTQLGLST